jgi:hypothetical protein
MTDGTFDVRMVFDGVTDPSPLTEGENSEAADTLTSSLNPVPNEYVIGHDGEFQPVAESIKVGVSTSDGNKFTAVTVKWNEGALPTYLSKVAAEYVEKKLGAEPDMVYWEVADD